jgi:isopentenyl-diphosphate delta-isomerase
VFFAHLDGGPEPAPDPDPGEVAECRWVSWAAFRLVAATAPWALSPWVVEQLPRLPA